MKISFTRTYTVERLDDIEMADGSVVNHTDIGRALEYLSKSDEREARYHAKVTRVDE